MFEECKLESLDELDNLSGWICCVPAPGQEFLAESDFLLDETLLQVSAMTIMTTASREPPIDAEMMMSSGRDSEMRK